MAFSSLSLLGTISISRAGHGQTLHSSPTAFRAPVNLFER